MRLEDETLLIALFAAGSLAAGACLLYIAQRISELRFLGEKRDVLLDKIQVRLKSLETWRANVIAKRLKKLGWDESGHKTRVAGSEDPPIKFPHKSERRRKPT